MPTFLNNLPTDGTSHASHEQAFVETPPPTFEHANLKRVHVDGATFNGPIGAMLHPVCSSCTLAEVHNGRCQNESQIEAAIDPKRVPTKEATCCCN